MVNSLHTIKLQVFFTVMWKCIKTYICILKWKKCFLLGRLGHLFAMAHSVLCRKVFEKDTELLSEQCAYICSAWRGEGRKVTLVEARWAYWLHSSKCIHCIVVLKRLRSATLVFGGMASLNWGQQWMAGSWSVHGQCR